DSSSDEATHEASQTPKDENLPSDDEVETFIDAIASNKLSDLEAAEDLVLPDSNAADYLRYYTHYTNALIDAGYSTDYPPSATEKIETGFELCDDDGHGETECSSYTNFKGKDGKIADF